MMFMIVLRLQNSSHYFGFNGDLQNALLLAEFTFGLTQRTGGAQSESAHARDRFLKIRIFCESFVSNQWFRARGSNRQSHVISVNEASLRHNCFEINSIGLSSSRRCL